MPRISPEARRPTELFRSFSTEAAKFGENNDCAVRAIAAATGASYAKVREILAKHGRKTGHGTPWAAIRAAIGELGFTYTERHPTFYLQNKYPNSGKGYSSITTHHPARLQQVWKDGRKYLFYTRGHVLAVIDGQNHDWTVGSSKRVLDIWEITKAPTALPYIA